MPTGTHLDSSQFRVTLFIGPEQVEGKPSTYSTVFNVKKRSWKGGVQVAVEIREAQIVELSDTTAFQQWLRDLLATVPKEERLSYQERAQELFIEAICWCKLDLLLQSGITQNNQRLAADAFEQDLNRNLAALFGRA